MMEKPPDFKRGYLEEGLNAEDFESLGPFQLFRLSFIESWKNMLELAKAKQVL